MIPVYVRRDGREDFSHYVGEYIQTEQEKSEAARFLVTFLDRLPSQGSVIRRVRRRKSH